MIAIFRTCYSNKTQKKNFYEPKKSLLGLLVQLDFKELLPGSSFLQKQWQQIQLLF